MKIAYCGYDFFHVCLAALIDAGLAPSWVFSVDCDNRYNYNHYITRLCQQHGIPLSLERVSESHLRQLADAGCELLITAAYNYRIPDLAPYGIKGVNVHPTLLPLGRGVWPLPWIILSEQRRSGVTLHQLTPDYDSGAILLQRDFVLAPDEDLETLSAKVQMLAAPMLPQVVANVEDYWRQARPQPPTTEFWPMPARAQRTLQWQKSVAELARICRAFGKFGCYASFDGQEWLVSKLVAWPQAHAYVPGSVVHKTNTEMIVAAADGLVSLQYFNALTP